MSSGVRSWFCVFNNPEWINIYNENNEIVDKQPSEFNGMEPQEICNLALELWTSSKDNRSGWVGYCVSAQGLHHLHMVLESKTTIEFSSVKKVFPRAHLSMTRGTKKEVEDYINKRGKFEEKGEEVICYASKGEIKGNQGSRSDLKEIQSMLDLGMKPSQIVGTDIKRQRYYNMIKSAYLLKRQKETPLMRQVRVYWHYGASGSGKSHTYVALAERHGRENVYKITRDLGRGKFDTYEGERILFLDEVKPNAMDWADLLLALDCYLYRPSARYQDSIALWEEVHVTSIYSPQEFWENAIPPERRKEESLEQLTRRITVIVHHVKSEDGRYLQEYGGDLNETDVQDISETVLPFDSKCGALEDKTHGVSSSLADELTS